MIVVDQCFRPCQPVLAIARDMEKKQIVQRRRPSRRRQGFRFLPFEGEFAERSINPFDRIVAMAQAAVFHGHRNQAFLSGNFIDIGNPFSPRRGRHRENGDQCDKRATGENFAEKV